MAAPMRRGLPKTPRCLIALWRRLRRRPHRSTDAGRLLRLQPVPAAFSEQQARIRRIRLDLLAQAIDVRLQRVRGDVCVVAPDFGEQLLAAHRLAAGAVEIFENVRLFLGEADLALLLVDQELRSRAELVRPEAEG